ncbi:MAG: hypothetical protein JNK65_06175, partial [Deltaproteobacteria bacterium]|nr:hypothetical protein [Deltaproteobacteria bacterium]
MSSPNITGNRASNVSPGYGGDYGNYGDTGNSMGPQDPGVQQQVQMYYQYAQMYQQVIAQGGPQAAQAQQYLQMVNGYLTQLGAAPVQDMMGQMGTEWDPTAQNQAQNVAMQFGGATPDYQDSSHIVFEKGSGSNITVDRNDSETKQVDVYTGDNALFIPSNAASVSFTTSDDTGAPGHKMITATITFPNGATRTVVYHKVDRENFALQVRAADPSNVALDGLGTLASKVTAIGLDEAGETETLGDPPTKMDAGTRVYDGSSFTIAPVQTGTDKKTNVMASGDVSIIPNSNSEYYTLEYVATDPSHYELKVYASKEDKTAGKVKETITMDAQLLDHLNLGMDPSRIEFLGGLKDPADAHNPLAGADGADKISFGETSEASGSGQAVNKNHPEDTPPSQVATDTATYDDSADVSLTNYFDGKVTKYDITASGTVTLNANKQSDKFSVSYDEVSKMFTITATGKDSKGVTKTITYKVSADQVDKID